MGGLPKPSSLSVRGAALRGCFFVPLTVGVMSSTNSAGHSSETPIKQQYFRKIVEQHISVVKQALVNAKVKAPTWQVSQTYYYIDITAGPGNYPDCLGSPLIFIDAAKRLSIPHKGYFIEHDKCCIEELERCLPSNGSYTTFNENNKSALPTIVQSLPSEDFFGLLYCDPNGIPDFDLLNWFSRQPKSKMVDILIRYNSMAVKRNEYRENVQRLFEYLGNVKKKYWVVQRPRKEDRWQWTFLWGLNWDGLRAAKRQGFYWTHSSEGRDIIARLHYKKDELQLRLL